MPPFLALRALRMSGRSRTPKQGVPASAESRGFGVSTPHEKAESPCKLTYGTSKNRPAENLRLSKALDHFCYSTLERILSRSRGPSWPLSLSASWHFAIGNREWKATTERLDLCRAARKRRSSSCERRRPKRTTAVLLPLPTKIFIARNLVGNAKGRILSI